MRRVIVACLSLVLAACNDDAAKGTDDMLLDAGVRSFDGPPTLAATRVGVAGDTCCIVSDGDRHVAYLVNPVVDDNGNVDGELHLATAAGDDRKVAAYVEEGLYTLAPDGSALLFVTATPSSSTGTLNWLDLGTPDAKPVAVISFGYPVVGYAQPGMGDLPPLAPLADNGAFSPSGNYFLVGILPFGGQSSEDLHVIDVHNGKEVYMRGDGAFDYAPELVLPDDTMIFEDDALTPGVGGLPATPVQTLYAIPLASAATAQPIVINTRVSQVAVTGDHKAIVYLLTNGDLFAWDLAARSGSGTRLASGAVRFIAGTSRVAFLGADRSVGVVNLDGTSALAIPSSAGADLFSPLVLSADDKDLYYFAKVNTQDSNGTLLHAAVAAGATPSMVGDHISLVDLTIADQAILFLRDVRAVADPGSAPPDAGVTGAHPVSLFGDAAIAARDGSGVRTLGMTSPVGGLLAATPRAGAWLAAHLVGAAEDATLTGTQLPQPLDQGATLLGGLAFASSESGAADTLLDAHVRAGDFRLGDDDRALVYIGGESLVMTPPPDGGFTVVRHGGRGSVKPLYSTYSGTLGAIDTSAPSMKRPAGLAGVSELGRIRGRSLFVNAPRADTPGVYFITY